MTRVPVPDDHERQYIGVSGSDDYHNGESDVNLDGVDHARNLTVHSDDDGRYVGVSERYAEDVADFLGVSLEDEGGDEETADEAQDQQDQDTETCDVVKADGEVCGRELPCPYHSDDEDEGDE